MGPASVIVTTSPCGPAADCKDIVQVTGLPPGTEGSENAIFEIAGASTTSEALCAEALRVAVIESVTVLVTGLDPTVNEAVVSPAGTNTV
jgi:hypothetical protein